MIPVLVYDKNQCDPRKCTAKRMLKFGLAKEVKFLNRVPFGSVVLSPFAEKALSPADIGYATHGIVVMDLTWTNIDEFPRPPGVNERALPYLIAANPINWGRPMELNSAEAVLASLIILGQREQAEGFFERFNWAVEFIRLNGELLDAYASAKDSSEVVRIQNEYVESIRRSRSSQIVLSDRVVSTGMIAEVIEYVWEVFGDERLMTSEVELRLARIFDYHCPDDFAKTMTKLRHKGLVKGEVSGDRGGWIWWVDDECRSKDLSKVV